MRTAMIAIGITLALVSPCAVASADGNNGFGTTQNVERTGSQGTTRNSTQQMTDAGLPQTTGVPFVAKPGVIVPMPWLSYMDTGAYVLPPGTDAVNEYGTYLNNHRHHGA